MAPTVCFDPTAPYDVDATDTPFARPAGAEMLARVYCPRGEPDHPLAGLVYVHGGAWARLDRTADSIMCQALAACGLVVALYPVADPLARCRYALSREDEPPPPSGFDAKRLIASHRAFFADEAAMEAASPTRMISSGEATTLPPIWVAQPDQDDNVPAAITDAFVAAYQRASGRIECAHFPGARHSFAQEASPDTGKCIALVRDFVGRQLAG